MGDPSETGRIEDRQRTVADLEQTAAAKLGQHFADVNGRQAGGVGNMMLTKRKFHLHWFLFGGPAALGKSLPKIENEPGNPLVGGAAAEVGD
jgi:hypothetical protein